MSGGTLCLYCTIGVLIFLLCSRSEAKAPQAPQAQTNSKVVTVRTKPFPDQNLTTNFVVEGLERSVELFSQEHYTENFIQTVFDVLKFHKTDKLFLVGGLGNPFCSEMVMRIVRVGAGNGVVKIYTGRGGTVSRPAMSYLATKYNCWGFLLHNSCHNQTSAGGQSFGIDIITPTGRPIDPDLLDEIFLDTQGIGEYHTVTTLENLQLARSSNMLFKIGSHDMVVAAIDAVSEYAKVIEGMFNFDRLNGLLSGSKYFRPFRIMIDCNNGAMGPYAKRIFEDELGAGKGCIVNSEQLDRAKGFGKRIKRGEMSIEREMRGSICDFGASLDGDGGRCMVFGRRGFQVSTGETLAIVTSHYHAIPFFLKHKLNGIGRTFSTPSMADNVAAKAGLNVFETPANWFYLNELLDSKKILVCEDDNYGMGSRHVPVRDGIWTILTWLSLVIHFHKPVKDIVTDHWLTYGRHCSTTYEFHDLTASTINKIFSQMINITFKVEGVIGSTRDVNGVEYKILEADKIALTLRSKKETNTENAMRVTVEPAGRILFRPFIVGDVGIIKIIVEVSTKDEPATVQNITRTENLFQIAMQMGKIEQFTSKTVPDHIY